jgi:hypothetical protein
VSTAVISDTVALSLATRFPDLPCSKKVTTKTVVSKGCCGRAAKHEVVVVNGSAEAMRLCLYQLGPEDLAKVKSALNVSTIILYMTTAGFPRRVAR